MALAILRRPTPFERGRYRSTRPLTPPPALPEFARFDPKAIAASSYSVQRTTRGTVYRLGVRALARETTAEVVLPNESLSDAIAFALLLARHRFGAPIVVDAEPAFAGKALAIASELGVAIAGAPLDRVVSFLERARELEQNATFVTTVAEEEESAELSRRPAPLIVARMLEDAQRPREGFGYFGEIVGLDDRWILLRNNVGHLTRHELHHFSTEQPPDVGDRVAIFYPPIPKDAPKRRRKIKPAVVIDAPTSTIVVTDEISVPQAGPSKTSALPAPSAPDADDDSPERPRKPKKTPAAKAPRPSRRRPG